MKTTEFSRKKITVVAAFLLLFAVLMLANARENACSEQLGQAANAIYKDRLVVASYVLRYDRELQSMKETILSGKNPESVKTRAIRSHSKMDELDSLYLSTVLTLSEKKCFNRFSQIRSSLKIQTSGEGNTETLQDIARAQKTLETLSEIQLTEGKKQIDHAARATSSYNIYANLETGMLFILVLIALRLVFSRWADSNKPRISLN